MYNMKKMQRCLKILILIFINIYQNVNFVFKNNNVQVFQNAYI